MHTGYRHGGQHLVAEARREGPSRFRVTIDGVERMVDATVIDRTTLQLCIDGGTMVAHVVRIGGADHVWLAGEVYVLNPEAAGGSPDHVLLAPPQVTAPMPGKVLQVLVEIGQRVAAGDGLLILEAMKMEHRITAAANALVRSVHALAGQMVDGGAVLVELDYEDPA